MPPTYFPLRWESTGDQWWYASPIDWATANGHYDLVRELLRMDSNHVIQLTSLRRIRRLETVWDDEEQFNDVAKCRCQVARKLFHECESKGSKNSLIHAGYGGWLMYTAAAAGDLGFVHMLLDKNPLLVFGEGEYGVTDIIYAAARSKNIEVFRLIFDFAVSPRFQNDKDGSLEEHVNDIPSVYKWEMTNRAVYAAARGGNVKILEELLSNCPDILYFRDAQGSTPLHAAAGRGQIEVLKFLTTNFDIVNSRDNHGNTALHIASYRGQLSAVETLISAFPSLIMSKNNAGETFLHKAISGFQTAAFRRLDRQIELMKQLVTRKDFHVGDVVNVKNNDGRTALHMAIIGNAPVDLVQLLTAVESIDVNVCDVNGMTPLDHLRQGPNSSTSDVIIRQLISAGAMLNSQNYTARRVIASRLKMQGSSNSPGTLFRISDAEILLYTGIKKASDAIVDHQGDAWLSSYPTEINVRDSNSTIDNGRRSSSVNYAAAKLKRAFLWPGKKCKKPRDSKSSMEQISMESSQKVNSISENPTPLRQRFSKPSSQINNKRTLSVRSNQSSPTAKKRFASGMLHGATQSMPHIIARGRSRSSSFSKSSISSPTSLDKQKGIYIDSEIAGPSCSNSLFNDDASNLTKQGSSGNKRLSGHYFCFGAPGLSIKTSIHKQQANQPALSVA